MYSQFLKCVRETVFCKTCGKKIEFDTICYHIRKRRSKFTSTLKDRYYCTEECFLEDNDNLIQNKIMSKNW